MANILSGGLSRATEIPEKAFELDPDNKFFEATIYALHLQGTKAEEKFREYVGHYSNEAQLDLCLEHLQRRYMKGYEPPNKVRNRVANIFNFVQSHSDLSQNKIIHSLDEMNRESISNLDIEDQVYLCFRVFGSLVEHTGQQRGRNYKEDPEGPGFEIDKFL